MTWLKLSLPLGFVLVLFVYRRMLDIAIYGSGGLSRRLLDPKTLSVLNLKTLLDSRGVSYTGMVEKSEFAHLVAQSGQVYEDEVVMAAAELEEAGGGIGEEVNFWSKEDFSQKATEAGLGAWLLRVDQTYPSTPHWVWWKNLAKELGRFGIRVGVSICPTNITQCKRYSSVGFHLVLAVPQYSEGESKYDFISYSRAGDTGGLYSWVRRQLQSRVPKISSLGQLERDWLSFPNSSAASQIRVILFQKTESVPMFFSTLSLKFQGKVRFGAVPTRSTRGKEMAKKHSQLNVSSDTDQASYEIVTPEMTVKYGGRRGESLSFSSMHRYLSSLYPNQNDLFNLSVVISNMVFWFLLITTGSAGGAFRTVFRCLIYNILFLFLYSQITRTFSFPLLDQLPPVGLKLIRNVASTDIAALLRNDYAYFSRSLPLSFISFVLYSTLVAYLCRRHRVLVEE